MDETDRGTLDRGSDWSAAIVRGAMAGGLATAIMTAAQLQVFPRLLPAGFQRRFLPRDVIRGIQRRALGGRPLRGRAEDAVVMMGHHGFGATGGAAFAFLREAAGANSSSPVSTGVLFGLGVWAVSYEGWIPLVGIMPATTERPPRKWLEPIAAHVVYGAALGAAYHLLRR